MAEVKKKVSPVRNKISNKVKIKNVKPVQVKLDAEEMAQAGLHFGHRTSRTHPKMEPYLYGTRNTVHIIDLEKTVEKFREALDFIKQIISENKILLLVGTKIQAKDLIRSTAEECGLPYVNERWIGGSLTNFEIIRKRVKYFNELEAKRKQGELEKYTKKEKAKIDRELQGLEKRFGGIKDLETLPDAIFVLDMRKDALAMKEARMKGIRVIGVADTNVDPNLADYPVPGSDDAVSSIRYILEKVKETIKNVESRK